jgi:hypothetical protein
MQAMSDDADEMPAVDKAGLIAEYRERLATIAIDKLNRKDVLRSLCALESELRDDLFESANVAGRSTIAHTIDWSDVFDDRVAALVDYAKGLGRG